MLAAPPDVTMSFRNSRVKTLFFGPIAQEEYNADPLAVLVEAIGLGRLNFLLEVCCWERIFQPTVVHGRENGSRLLSGESKTDSRTRFVVYEPSLFTPKVSKALCGAIMVQMVQMAHGRLASGKRTFPLVSGNVTKPSCQVDSIVE